MTISALRHLDLEVCSSVAVNRKGVRALAWSRQSAGSSFSSSAKLIRIDIEMIETTQGWKVNRVNILQSPDQPPFP